MKRRELLKLISIGGASLPLLSTVSPLAFGQASGGNNGPKLVWILLRGAMDGLAAVPPYGEGALKRLRPKLAQSTSGAEALVPLNGLFGLHHQLPTLAELYRAKQLVIAPATGSPYRGRSHFDGQKILENGTTVASGTVGWLNRAVSASSSLTAMAVGAATPLVLNGPAPVNSWGPSRLPGTTDDLLNRLEWLYRQDQQLSRRLNEAITTAEMVDDSAASAKVRRNRAFPIELARQAGRFLSAPNGPNILTLEAGGWDTHANQGSGKGRLANQFKALDNALAALRDGLGKQWRQTAVVITSEFGRTVKENGTGGTDHGTGGALFLAGGAVAGGRMVGDWPGIGSRDLYEGRDLYPATDTRAILKGVLMEHLGIAEGALHDTVFPGSNTIAPIEGLIT